MHDRIAQPRGRRECDRGRRTQSLGAHLYDECHIVGHSLKGQLHELGLQLPCHRIGRGRASYEFTTLDANALGAPNSLGTCALNSVRFSEKESERLRQVDEALIVSRRVAHESLGLRVQHAQHRRRRCKLDSPVLRTKCARRLQLQERINGRTLEKELCDARTPRTTFLLRWRVGRHFEERRGATRGGQREGGRAAPHDARLAHNEGVLLSHDQSVLCGHEAVAVCVDVARRHALTRRHVVDDESEPRRQPDACHPIAAAGTCRRADAYGNGRGRTEHRHVDRRWLHRTHLEGARLAQHGATLDELDRVSLADKEGTCATQLRLHVCGGRAATGGGGGGGGGTA